MPAQGSTDIGVSSALLRRAVLWGCVGSIPTASAYSLSVLRGVCSEAGAYIREYLGEYGTGVPNRFEPEVSCDRLGDRYLCSPLLGVVVRLWEAYGCVPHTAQGVLRGSLAAPQYLTLACGNVVALLRLRSKFDSW
jgi:hypothetical protein